MLRSVTMKTTICPMCKSSSKNLLMLSIKVLLITQALAMAAVFQYPSCVYQKFWCLKVHLYLCIVKTLLMCLQSRCTSIFHCCEPPLHLLFSLAFHVYDIYINASIFLDNPCSRATLLQVMSWQNLFQSHDFTVYLCKMCHKLQYSPSYVLCNIIHTCFVMQVCLPPRAFYMRKFHLSRGLRLPSKMPQLFMAIIRLHLCPWVVDHLES